MRYSRLNDTLKAIYIKRLSSSRALILYTNIVFRV